MKRYLLIVIITAAVSALLGTAFLRGTPDVDARELVSKALLQHNSASYVANITTTSGHVNKAFHSRATVYHHGENERIEQGKVWALITGRTTYTCLANQGRMLVGTASDRLTDKDRVRLILKNYEPRVESTERIAGRTAYAVHLQPRSGSGPSKRLWIDRERFVVLKSVDYSAAGDRRTQMEVTKIEFNAKRDPAVFKVPCGTQRQQITISEPAEPKAVGRKLKIPVTQPTYLPSGYVPEGSYFYKCQCNCGHQALLTTYTDGLNTISVFQSPSGASCNSGACKTGDHGCVVQESEIARLGQVERGSRTVVVVADLKPEEIRRIAESVK